MNPSVRIKLRIGLEVSDANVRFERRLARGQAPNTRRWVASHGLLAASRIDPPLALLPWSSAQKPSLEYATCAATESSSAHLSRVDSE
jgi:hypothetical protein